jgi:[CysO sulfur-carrier protein]-S-L-cysteine hydrolase
MIDHSLTLSPAHLDAMRRHVAHESPLEACGLLAGKNGVVELVLAVKNAAESKVRFRMEPRAQLRAFEHIEAAGQDVLAIFHSHPKGPSVPSPTDIKEAAYPVVHIIWSPVGRNWHARGFWIEEGHAAEVPLNVQTV